METINEAQLKVVQQLSNFIQKVSGEVDEDGAAEFADLVVGVLQLTVTEVNEDGTYKATIELLDVDEFLTPDE